MNNLGRKLKAARVLKGMTQVELSKETGVSIETIRKIEQGYQDSPLGKTIAKFAKVLDQTTDYFLMEEVK